MISGRLCRAAPKHLSTIESGAIFLGSTPTVKYGYEKMQENSEQEYTLNSIFLFAYEEVFIGDKMGKSGCHFLLSG